MGPSLGSGCRENALRHAAAVRAAGAEARRAWRSVDLIGFTPRPTVSAFARCDLRSGICDLRFACYPFSVHPSR